MRQTDVVVGRRRGAAGRGRYLGARAGIHAGRVRVGCVRDMAYRAERHLLAHHHGTGRRRFVPIHRGFKTRAPHIRGGGVDRPEIANRRAFSLSLSLTLVHI